MSQYIITTAIVSKHSPPEGSIMWVFDGEELVAAIKYTSYRGNDEVWFEYNGRVHRYFTTEYEVLTPEEFQDYLRYTHVQVDDHWEVELDESASDNALSG